MNNMTQTFAERIRRSIGVGRSLVFSWIKAERRFGKRETKRQVSIYQTEKQGLVSNEVNGERKFADKHVNRRFGERETEFTVPQTDCEAQTAKRTESGFTVVSWVDEERGSSQQKVKRRFGKRQTGRQFTVPQTGRESRAMKCGKSSAGNKKAFLRWISNSINRSARVVFVGKKAVSSNSKRKFAAQTVDRKFGKRQTERQLTVPQTDHELRAGNTAKSRKSGVGGTGDEVGRKAQAAKRGKHVLAHRNLFTCSQVEGVKGIFAGLARGVFSHGKSVSEMSKQKINSTSCKTAFGRSPRLVVGEKKNNTRRSLNMNNTEKTLHQDKSCEVQVVKSGRDSLAHGKTLMKDQVKSAKSKLVELVREVFSFGKCVSNASNQQVNNTSPHLVVGGGKKNNTRRSLNMNRTKKTLRRGARRNFVGMMKSMFGKIAQRSLSGEGTIENKIRRKIEMNNLTNKASGISGVESRKNKTKRGTKMNNRKQTFMKRVSRTQVKAAAECKTFGSVYHKVMKSTRRVAAKAAAMLVMASMVATSNPTAGQSVAAKVGELYQDARYFYGAHLSSRLTSPVFAALGETTINYGVMNGLVSGVAAGSVFGGAGKQVKRIEISPQSAVVREGERLVLTAVAYDASGNIVQGTAFKWQQRDVKEAQAKAEELESGGTFAADDAGIYQVTAEAGGVIGAAIVIVRRDDGYTVLEEMEREEQEKNGFVDQTRGKRVLRKEVRELLAKPRKKVLKNSSRMSDAEKDKLEKEYEKVEQELEEEEKEEPTTEVDGWSFREEGSRKDCARNERSIGVGGRFGKVG